MTTRFLEKAVRRIRIEARFQLRRHGFLLKPDEISKKTILAGLPPDPIIVEAGAHTGGDTVEFARLRPDATIFAFEPLPDAFEILYHNTRKFPNTTCLPLALTDQAGVSDFHVSRGGGDASSSLSRPKTHVEHYPGIDFSETIPVETICLGDWAIENDIQSIDLLWLDLQGHEPRALRGCGNLLPKIGSILTEVSTTTTYEDVMLYPEYRSWLQSLGFEFVAEAIPSAAPMGNAFFRR